MWTTLALAAFLAAAPGQAQSPGQTQALKLTNIRATYGILGAERKDTKILPGDIYCISFDIEGLKANEEDRASYRLTLQVTNKAGKVVYTFGPVDQEVYLSLGGSTTQSSVILTTDLNQAAGEYTARVVVVDKMTKSKQEFTRKVEILDKEFGIIRLGTTRDVGGNFPSPPIGVAGEFMSIHFEAAHFDKDANRRQQPDLAAEMRILDEKNVPVASKPSTGGVNDDVPLSSLAVAMRFTIALNRPGKFTIELQVTDKVSKKKVKKLLPLTVLDQKTSSDSN